MKRVILVIAVLLAAPVRASAAAPWQAGVAKIAITPDEPMWLSGYGSRDRASEGKLHDIHAKALVLDSPAGERAVLVTLDLVGIHREQSVSIAAKLSERFGLERSQIALATSHTHTGPVVGRNLEAMYFLDDANWKRVREYARELEEKVVKVVGDAIGSIAPCRASWATGHASFAVNRRENREASVPDLRERGALAGPVDHDVPVLAIRTLDGTLRAAVFGYACHATVLSFFQVSGDYPGFAQLAFERLHPGATALFWAGCGADQNPLPRRQVKLAEDYGEELARAVDRVLRGAMRSLEGGLRTRYSEIPLPYDSVPDEAALVEASKSSNRYVARRAKLLLDDLHERGSLEKTYAHYPVQVWMLGDELRFVLLGGEVVVDYSLRIKRELGGRRTWVAGYVNDVMAYIPSLRVLREGGYEGESAMIYYGLPSKWAESVEKLVMREVHALAK